MVGVSLSVITRKDKPGLYIQGRVLQLDGTRRRVLQRAASDNREDAWKEAASIESALSRAAPDKIRAVEKGPRGVEKGRAAELGQSAAIALRAKHIIRLAAASNGSRQQIEMIAQDMLLLAIGETLPSRDGYDARLARYYRGASKQLTQEGIKEIDRLFARGEDNETIAARMAMHLVSVRERRLQWAPDVAPALEWRALNGTLTEDGVVEIERRFAAGESNATIRTAMKLSLDSVRERRRQFVDAEATKND